MQAVSESAADPSFGELMRILRDPLPADSSRVTVRSKESASSQEATGGRVPSTKRQRTFQRNVERARKAIQAGEIKPCARDVAEHCRCANRTAVSILAELTELGVIERTGRLWQVVDVAA